MEVFKLLEVCEVYQPKTISKKELKDDGKYKVYGANGVIGFYEQFNHEESEILLTCRGATCGAVNVSEPFSWINGNAMVVKPIDNLLTRNYIKYFLQTIDKKSLITGAAQPQITRSSLEKLKIPVPSLQEQKKIVERLDKVFNYVDLNLKNIEHTDFETDKLFASIIHEIFLEKEVRLGNLIELNYGKDLDKKERGDKFKIPLYGSNGIMDFASKPLHDEVSVIVGRKGSVGELQYVEVPFWVIDVGFYVTLKNTDHLMRYYYYLLKSLNLQNLSIGVKPGLNRNKVYEILVPNHDLNQQKKIVDKLDKLFLLKQQMQNLSIKKTTSNTSLKRSILNKEFFYE